jgi:hypothetical protein
MSTFNIYINDTRLSFAMQRSFDPAELYFMIQQYVFSSIALRSMGLTAYSPIISPVLMPFKDLLHVRLTTPGIREDRWTMEYVINNWITSNAISIITPRPILLS